MLPAAAQAQTISNAYTGFVTVFIGASHAGDINDPGWTPGVSLAVTDSRGFGAEVDLSHVRQFNRDRFLESGITTLTANITWIRPVPDADLRP